MDDIEEKQIEFNYKFKIVESDYYLTVPLTIPFLDSTEEFVQRLIQKFNAPQYIENDLNEALSNFISESTNKYYDEQIENLLLNPPNINDITKKWETAFREYTTAYCDHVGESDEEVFALAYHKLVHSSALEAILQTEHTYAQGVRNCVKQQTIELDNLSSKQMSEMTEAIEGLDVTTSEQKINELAIKHFEDHSYLQAQCSSELNTIKEVQRREFRNWVMEMLEEHASSVSPLSSPKLNFMPPINLLTTTAPCTDHLEESPVEESFTIHLGSQMKQMYNIRLISSDVTDFFHIYKDSSGYDAPFTRYLRSKFSITFYDRPTSELTNTQFHSILIEINTHYIQMCLSHNSPQRLQTAMALYSNDLCGLVLLTDLSLGFNDNTKEFIKICQESTEFHFAHVEDQLEGIGECARNTPTYQKRSEQQIEKNKPTNVEWQTALQWSLRPGDVFITCHSNLAKVHVVFHLIVDSSLRQSDINSRHRVILGLRNILKMACSNNITTLTIPLLLQHDMTEEMTVQWCTKRAELIFKCVKGFMIEMASWGGSELKNLQFLIPKGISSSVFTSLATMLPSIFKLSNPVVFKAINSKHS